MHALLVSLLLVATPSTAEEGSAAAVTPPPAPPSAADSVVAAAFQHPSIGTKSADVQAPVSSSNWSSFAAPGFALAALAALAFALTRRRAKSTRSISVVETASLGPKRSLVIADVMGERMVLGVSEAGISVLSTRAAPQPEPAPFVIPAPLETVSTSLSKEMSFFDRVLGRVPQPNAVASFDETLRDSLEDQELRAKLSLGQRSVVP